MADASADTMRAMTQMTAALIELAARLASALMEMRIQRLRAAAIAGEHAARTERARLATHHAADVAIWRRTTNPAWWQKATPEQIARAWQAVNIWHHADDEAVGVRQAMAQRLREQGIDVTQPASAIPDDVRWLHTALARAHTEREQQAARTADLDTDRLEPPDDILWDDDELAGPGLAAPQDPRSQAVQDKTSDVRPQNQARPAAPAPPTGESRPYKAAQRTAKSNQDRASQQVDKTTPESSTTQRKASPTRRPDNLSSKLSTRQMQWDGETIEGEIVADSTSTPTPGPATLTALVNDGWPSAVNAQPPTDAQGQRINNDAKSQVPAAPGSEEPFAGQESTKQSNSTAAQLDANHMQSLLRQAWPKDAADRVLTDAAWPMLANTMHQLEQAGGNLGLLLERVRGLDTTQAKLPAVLTAWALRNAAAGPTQLRKAQRQRASHQQRIQTMRQNLAPPGDETASRPDTSRAQSSADIHPNPKLLRTAFPATTRQAINRMRNGGTVSQPSGQTTVRARKLQRGTSKHERGL